MLREPLPRPIPSTSTKNTNQFPLLHLLYLIAQKHFNMSILEIMTLWGIIVYEEVLEFTFALF